MNTFIIRFKQKVCVPAMLLLLIIASAPGTTLFENDCVRGYENDLINSGIELVHNSEYVSQSSALLLLQDGIGNGLAKCRVPSLHFCTPNARSIYFVAVNVQINTPPDCPAQFHSTPFNIPHQNSADGDVFILPPNAG